MNVFTKVNGLVTLNFSWKKCFLLWRFAIAMIFLFFNGQKLFFGQSVKSASSGIPTSKSSKHASSGDKLHPSPSSSHPGLPSLLPHTHWPAGYGLNTACFQCSFNSGLVPRKRWHMHPNYFPSMYLICKHECFFFIYRSEFLLIFTRWQSPGKFVW